jgi:hypothetical protein
MARYRIFRLDPKDRIIAAYPVECQSDDMALRAARRVWQWAAAVEVREGSRHVARMAPVPPWDPLRAQWTGSRPAAF